MATTNTLGTLAATGVLHNALGVTLKKLPFLGRLASDIAPSMADKLMPFNVAQILKNYNAGMTVYDRSATGSYAVQDAGGLALPAGVQGDELVDHAVTLVPFANAEQGAPVRAHAAVGIPQAPGRWRLGRDGGGRGSLASGALLACVEVQTVQPLVRELAEEDRDATVRPFVQGVGAASVLVHEGAHVGAGRRHVLGLAPEGATHQRRAATVERAGFEPEQRAARRLQPPQGDA